MDEDILERLRRLEAQHADFHRDLPAVVSTAVTSSIARVVEDKTRLRQYLTDIYEVLKDLFTEDISKWVGKRLLTSVVMALMTAAVVWAVKTGAIK